MQSNSEKANPGPPKNMGLGSLPSELWCGSNEVRMQSGPNGEPKAGGEPCCYELGVNMNKTNDRVQR